MMIARISASPRMVLFCRRIKASAPCLMAFEIFCICGVPVSWLITYLASPTATSSERRLIPSTAIKYCCPDPADSPACNHRARTHGTYGIQTNPPDYDGSYRERNTQGILQT